MRSDMSKVIVERPRCRRSRKAGSAYPRGHLENQWDGDWEESPRMEAMGRVYGEKFFNENLRPLVRFLRTNVGRPWDKVHSEISKQISCNSTVQKHVLDHLRDFVKEDVEFSGKVILDKRGDPYELESRGMQLRFYVCPRTGILRLAPIVPSKKRWQPKADADRRVLGRGHELRRIDGIWYEVTFVEIPDTHEIRMVTKRQLNTREIMRHGAQRAS